MTSRKRKPTGTFRFLVRFLTDNGYSMDRVLTRARSAGRAIVAAAAVVAAVLVAAAAASAATPSAITGPVTSVTGTTATLTGTVNPNGDATTWHFEYGKTTSYGSTTTSTNAGSGTANTGVTATISGLTPGTTYHYRVVATSSGGTTQGADGIFNTPAAPVVATSAASSITSTSATLNGAVNPNGRPTTYWFEYGKSTNYGTKTPVVDAGSGTTAVTVSASISGLQSGQTYHFRIVATSDAGTALGGDTTFAAAGTGPTVKTKPATSVTATSAKLNGALNPSGQATTWYFDYGLSTSYGSRTSVGSVPAGTRNLNVSVTVGGLGPGLYHFRLVAANASGTTVGDDLTFGSAGPPVVQTGTAQGASTNGVTLTGSVNPGGNNTNWYFDYGLTATYGMKTQPKSAGSGTAVTGVSAVISKLTAGTTYHYRLVATSNAGTSYGSDVTFTTVSALTLTASTAQSVYGHIVTLSGVVSSRQTGVKVEILAQPFGSSSSATIGSALTTAGGTWTYQARPKIQTVYKASAPEGTSTGATVGVRPAVSLRLITGQRFSSRVVAEKSFAGKTVQLQRLLPGNRWATVAKAKLNSKSSAVFSASSLPRGSSMIRVAMSVNQAGAGYLGGFSRTLSYKR
jgi:hypothetical protein